MILFFYGKTMFLINNFLVPTIDIIYLTNIRIWIILGYGIKQKKIYIYTKTLNPTLINVIYIVMFFTLLKRIVLPYRSLGTKPEIFQYDETIPAYKRAATVVHRTLPYVPTVQVPRN